ncbi:MAG: hypothetical protein ACRDVE_19185, partial [Actinocrinis sp.]
MTSSGARPETGELSVLLALASAEPSGRHDATPLGPLLAAFRAAADGADARGAVHEGGATSTVESVELADRRWGTAVPPGRARARRRVVSLSFAVRGAAVLLVVCGGAMAAADAGMLPDPIQRIAHQYLGGVGVPTPSGPAGGSSAAATASGTGTPSGPGSSPTPAPTTSSAASAE